MIFLLTVKFHAGDLGVNTEGCHHAEIPCYCHGAAQYLPAAPPGDQTFRGVGWTKVGLFIQRISRVQNLEGFFREYFDDQAHQSNYSFNICAPPLLLHKSPYTPWKFGNISGKTVKTYIYLIIFKNIGINHVMEIKSSLN